RSDRMGPGRTMTNADWLAQGGLAARRVRLRRGKTKRAEDWPVRHRARAKSIVQVDSCGSDLPSAGGRRYENRTGYTWWSGFRAGRRYCCPFGVTKRTVYDAALKMTW